MIGSLRGTLLDRSGLGEVLVEVAGVGYRVTVAPATQVALGEVGTEVFVHVHHHVREDGETLFGFVSRDERVAFEALLGAHGVGPALALAILSVHAPDALRRLLADDDLQALCLVPGVGKKTAARLLVELKSRLDVDHVDLTPTSSARLGGRGSVRADVREALVELGYGPEEVGEALRDLADRAQAEDADQADADAGELLREALRRLGARR
ncbi:Holliday junction branch migration protein RuvA [soil metagenome]